MQICSKNQQKFVKYSIQVAIIYYYNTIIRTFNTASAYSEQHKTPLINWCHIKAFWLFSDKKILRVSTYNIFQKNK